MGCAVTARRTWWYAGLIPFTQMLVVSVAEAQASTGVRGLAWTARVGGANIENCFAVGAFADESLLIGGRFNTSTVIGAANATLTSLGVQDAAVFKVNADGTVT